jgi:hypothetical protein
MTPATSKERVSRHGHGGQAIAHSLNIATIALAQQVGYENVAALARSAGIVNARGTPSVAIGTYNATPIDMAGAYTVFANNGVHLKPWMLASVRNSNGDIVADFAPEAKQVLDPRTAFLTQSLLENVMTFGTGSAARAARFCGTGRGQDGDKPRRLVRGLLLEPSVYYLGRQRRLHQRQSPGRAGGSANLGRVYESRDQAAAIFGHEAVQPARRRECNSRG